MFDRDAQQDDRENEKRDEWNEAFALACVCPDEHEQAQRWAEYQGHDTEGGERLGLKVYQACNQEVGCDQFGLKLTTGHELEEAAEQDQREAAKGQDAKCDFEAFVRKARVVGGLLGLHVVIHVGKTFG